MIICVGLMNLQKSDMSQLNPPYIRFCKHVCQWTLCSKRRVFTGGEGRQYAAPEVCTDWRTNWEVGTNFYFRLRWIYARMTKVRRRCNGVCSGSSQILGTVNTKLDIPELQFLSKFTWYCLFYWSSAVRNSSILSIKNNFIINDV